jgi:2-polyprenyl-6-hydroxyphenyl methylase/3-demethylubiquinone-9 3-methyltransferase
MQKMNTQPSTVDPQEYARFERIAKLWWDEGGPFWPLHRMNQLRVDFIVEAIRKAFPDRVYGDGQSLNGVRVLDIGCGGGILSEAMARMGAEVTGIDMVSGNIEIAKTHARSQALSIDYRVGTVESLFAEIGTFDAVLNMEVIEHVSDVPLFMQVSSALVRPRGIMCVATLNRSLRAFFQAIVGAEYVLRWLPRGTHQWGKFIKPSELRALLQANGLNLLEATGVTLNPVTRQFRKVRSLAVNYVMIAQKSPDGPSIAR